MPPSETRPAVAVYARDYLAISMTFIHRQLLGVSERFDAIALAMHLVNIDVFSYAELYANPRTLLEKVYGRVASALTGRYTFASPRQIASWVRLLQQREVRLIHAHFGPWGIDMLPVARRLGVPLVVSFHGVDASAMLRDRKYVRGLKDLFVYAHVISASENLSKTLLSVGASPEKLDIHYIGIPVERFPYVERRPVREKVAAGLPIRFLQVSNFVEKKGHKYTVEAFGRLLDRYPGAELVFAGDGPTRPEIEAMCRTPRLRDKVTFLGRVLTDRVVELMREADVFLHHSVTGSDGDKEATTTVVAEAMSTGLIVMGSYHGGIPEMIGDGVNGFLVEERDVETYTEKMLLALQQGGEMGRRASETVRVGFNLSKQNDKLMDIYEKLIR